MSSRLSRLILAVLSTAVMIGGSLAFGSEEPVHASVVDPNRIDRLVEFPDVPLEQVGHWADWTLRELGVPEADWGCPDPGDVEDPHERCQYVFWSYPAVWLKLTQTEVDNLDGVASANGFRVMAPRPMSVPEIGVEGLDSGFQHPGGNGREIIPFGLTRIGFNPFDLPEHTVKVGILDTGVDGAHDDLVVAGGADCTFGGHPDRYLFDYYGHGTHVAGTVAAELNGSYVAGGNPNAELWSFKVLSDEGWGSDASVACGVDQALMHNMAVINMSLGGGGEPTPCDSWDISHNIFCNASDMGLVIVVAAGNDGVDAYFKSPANYGESVVTVSAFADYDGEPGGRGTSRCNDFAADDEFVFFSNIGSLNDFTAPGVCVQSTVPGNADAWFSGTSMATPHVTAVISDYLGRYPECSIVVVREIREWSRAQMANDEFTGDWDAFPEPIVKFGAPECDEEEQS